MPRETAGKYAERTTVPVAQSIEEAKVILRRYGVDRIGVLEEPRVDTIVWYISSTPYRLQVLGARDSTEKEQQAHRQRWRALCILLKAFLEHAPLVGIEPGVVLLPYAVLPDGRTVAEAAPQLVGTGWAALLPPPPTDRQA